MLIICLYVSDYKKEWDGPLKKAQCNARGGAHDSGERVNIHIFYRQQFYFIAIGGGVEREIFSL